MSRYKVLWLVTAMSLLLASCGGGGGSGSDPVTLRLGYFPNITHATAIAGVEEGIFARNLEGGLEARPFNAGPEAIEALFGGALDAAYIGPSPAINAFIRSDGEAIRILAGATSGGAFFVVKPEIRGSEDLRGRSVATPQLGNTQDIALRSWLLEHGLDATLEGGGDVSVSPAPNAQILETFRAGTLDGGWVPEPWATRMIVEGGGHVLVDERDLWPDGRYVTTHLIVRTSFLREHPDVVRQLIEAHVEADRFVREEPERARAVVQHGIEDVTGVMLPDELLVTAWENLTFTVDPIAHSLQRSADEAVELGFLEASDLTRIYDLAILNELLIRQGQDPVEGL